MPAGNPGNWACSSRAPDAAATTAIEELRIADCGLRIAVHRHPAGLKSLPLRGPKIRLAASDQ